MKKKNFIAAFMIVFAVMLSSFAFYSYQMLYTPNILIDQEDKLFTIPAGMGFKELQNKLYDERIVNDLVSFSFLSKVKGYDERIKPGLYLLKSDMSNTEAINLLRSGNQTPVKITFNSVRKIEELANKLSMTLQMDSADIAPFLLSDSIAQSYGFNAQTFIAMFLPNTYEVYWTITPKELLDRMKKEYDKYWTTERVQMAEAKGLTPVEVVTLASIVDAETNMMSEAPTIAGVYLNRLEKGYKFQADPTLKFAMNNFEIKRLLNKDMEFESPYNTYKYFGLPPGPINMPSIAAVEAVLNAEDHRFLYFCAKPDFSGYHVFANTLIEHNKNAHALHRVLNQNKIYR
ncbi:MAG: endolytic transglycosylase MltG [Cyclobacteriaceae bacterium]